MATNFYFTMATFDTRINVPDQNAKGNTRRTPIIYERIPRIEAFVVSVAHSRTLENYSTFRGNKSSYNSRTAI